MNEKAEDLAFGRWPDILMARGLDASFFNGKAGPCPFCGGRDRYRWNQRKFGGVWVCNSCTDDKYSNGFQMLMRHMGYHNFREAADDVREFFGSNPSIQPIPRHVQLSQDTGWTPEKIAFNHARMIKTLDEAVEVRAGDPVSRYIQNRVPGMSMKMDNVRFHPCLAYWAPPVEDGGRPVKLGDFPAMLSAAQDAQGNLVQLHKTYLTPDGFKANVPIAKKTDLGVGCNSYAVRMMEPIGDTLGVCEGMETGWASVMLKNIPVWPCLSGPVLSEFTLPQELRNQVKKLIIFADSDDLKVFGRHQDGSNKLRRPGSWYAEKCAERARSQGLRSLIIRPAKTGADFADYWGNAVAA